MADDPIEMPCLGRPFRLGMLYDCRSEKLIPRKTLWGDDVLHKVRTEDHSRAKSTFKVIAEDTIEQKAFHIGVDTSLKLSLMGGLVIPSDAARYFHDQKPSNRVARVSLQYKSTSKFEQLEMDLLATGQIQHPQIFEDNNATHVVTGVLYGAEAFFVFDQSVPEGESVNIAHRKMKALIEALPGITDVGGDTGTSFKGADKYETDNLHFKFYGDIPLAENPSTFQDAIRIYQQLPKILGGKDNPKFVPKKVWLCPLGKFDSRHQQIVREISVGLINDVQQLFEEIHELEMQSNDIGASDVYQHFKGLREQMSKFRRELSGLRSNLVKKLSVLLPKIRRGGGEEAKLKEFNASPFAPQQLLKWLQEKEEKEKTQLNSYLARLKKSQFQFFLESDLGKLQLEVGNVVCFAFKVCGEDDPYLQALASYVRTGHQPPPASKPAPWYEDREVKQSMRRQLQMFEEFAKVNEAEDDIKFVVTDISLASSTGKNGAVTVLYNNGSPIEFEPPSQPGTPSVTKILHDKVTLQWCNPVCGSNDITSYTVLWHSENDPRDKWKPGKISGLQLSAIVSGLTPETTYSFKVKAKAVAGFSPDSGISEPATTKLEPPSQPGTPCITGVSYDTMTIKWSAPACGTANITNYTVLYHSVTADQWTIHKTASPQLSAEVNGLTPETTYVFKVIAECKDGFTLSLKSDASKPITTKIEPPGPPGKPHKVKVHYTDITIKWSKPDHGNANITSYTVFYCSDSTSQWMTCKTNGSQLSLTVSELQRQTKYKFKVKAEVKGVFGHESCTSEPITTLPPSEPETPRVTKAFHDNIIIEWSKPKHGADNIISYTVFYHSTHDTGDTWMNQKTGNALTSATVTNLKPATAYCFKVRAECDSGFSPESGTSKYVHTKSKPHSRVAVEVKGSQSDSKCIDPSAKPHIYQLLTVDAIRDHDNKIAKCLIGKRKRINPAPERVLMVVGATGAGKSTLINGIANYILGVKWDDEFRFKLITDEGKKSQAESQTEWITAYTFHLRDSSRVPFTLTVIDTPGFGDCRGIERDRKIVEQIKQFFSIRGRDGIDQLHGVGFVVQASLPRLTPTQGYVFDSVLSIYGKDIEDNIFMLVTFADGSRPPVLTAIKEANIPHQKHFKFNNSALYAKFASGGFDEMFWKLGVQSFGDFFGVFGEAEARSLTLTREVLSEREQLETVVQELHPQIRAGLSKMEQLRQQTEIVKRNKALIEENKDFTFKVTVPKSERKNTEPGQYVTNCLKCNHTCHERCAFANDEDKHRCWAMTNGSCRICPGKCHWENHVNQPFWYYLYETEETQTSEDLKRRYDTATQGKSKAEAMTANMRQELDQVEDNVLGMVSQVRTSLNRLGEIALKPNLLTEVAYIDLLIEGEKQEAKPGWMNRVRAYEQVKEKSKLVATVNSQTFEKGSVFTSLADEGACSADLGSSETGRHQSQSFTGKIRNWWS